MSKYFVVLLFILAQFCASVRVRHHAIQQFRKSVPSVFKFVKSMRFKA
jgi:fumarate reductase subunit D